MLLFRYNLRSLLVRRTSALLTVLGLALVVLVFAATLMLLAGLHQTLRASGRADMAVVLRAGSEAELTSQFPLDAAMRVAALPGVAQGQHGPLASAEVVVTMTLAHSDGYASVVLRGVGVEALRLRPEVQIVEGRAPTAGTEEVMVGRAIAGRFAETVIGGNIDLIARRPVRVVGVFSANGSSLESEIWGDREIVARAVGREALISSVRLQLTAVDALAGLADRLAADETLGLIVLRETDYQELQGERMARVLLGLGALLTLCFMLGGVLAAAITLHAQVAHRAREIGTLRALGFSSRQVLAGFVLEALVLGLLGGALGCLAALALGPVRFSLINPASWSELVFRLHPTAAVLGAALAFSALMALLGGLWPAINASRVPPVRAMRD